MQVSGWRSIALMFKIMAVQEGEKMEEANYDFGFQRTSAPLRTTEYIESLPEGKRAELIDGHVYYMAAPSTFHQELVHQISWTIENYIRKNQGNCKVFPAPFAVYINDDKYSYLEPDISVICNPDKLDEKGCHGAPDWVIEVVSPSSRAIDYILKLFKYHAAGVREYWIVDPSSRQVITYSFDEPENAGQYLFSDDIPVSIYPGYSINLEQLVGR